MVGTTSGSGRSPSRGWALGCIYLMGPVGGVMYIW